MSADRAAMVTKAVVQLAGPAIFLAIVFGGPSGLSPEARRTLAVAGWMIVWWITEAVPIIATSLLPVLLFPLLGIASTKDTTTPYANDLVFLFMGGFFLAMALESWQSHVRIAYRLLLAVGLTGRRAVFGMMVATAAISMWISNTATTAMMYPIAIAVGGLFGADQEGNDTRTALMLGVAYAASIGGMGTIIGTPPNLVVVGALKQLAGVSLGFADFMVIGVPIVAILLPLCWVILVLICFPTKATLGDGARRLIHDRLADLGPIRGGEARVLAIFALTALAWFSREPKAFGSFRVPGLIDLAPGLNDAAIGVGAAIVLFLARGRRPDGALEPLLRWEDARRIPWDVLLFFGAGLTLAAALEKHGLTTWMAGGLRGLSGLPPFAIYLGVGVTVLVLSELASNLAVATMTMPIAASLAGSVGLSPAVMMLVAGFAASTGFALPIATPPNAIAFGSGQITVRQMAKAGLILDLAAVILVVAIVTALGPIVLGSR